MGSIDYHHQHALPHPSVKDVAGVEHTLDEGGRIEIIHESTGQPSYDGDPLVEEFEAAMWNEAHGIVHLFSEAVDNSPSLPFFWPVEGDQEEELPVFH